MKDLVNEIPHLIRFQETTVQGDVVLIAGENPRMIVYALVDRIEPDLNRSDKWWHVTIKVLSVPPQEIVWTLRESQFTGKEVFSMGGDKRFMQAVQLDKVTSPPEPGKDGGKDQVPPANPFKLVK